MSPDIYAGTAIGIGSLGAGIYTTNLIRRKWSEFIERQVDKRYGRRPQTHVTPNLIAQIVHEQFTADHREIRSRLTRIETAALDTLVVARAIQRPPALLALPKSAQAMELEVENGDQIQPPSLAALEFLAVIGKNPDGDDVKINLERLVATRLLVTASSGAGKSWLLRRLIEQTQDHVQIICVDSEGEFQSLRDRKSPRPFNVIEISIGHVAGAGRLAKETMAQKQSVVLDISELPPDDRIRFVAIFVEAMINLPREMWSPVMIALDEAHVFSPESSNTESSKAVKDLLSRGRKRGQFAILATQRLSKLSKDACAECLNIMVGRSSLDIDIKRGAESLGFRGKDPERISRLEIGQFFCHGPAFSDGAVHLANVGPVETIHPTVGTR
jgi:hypothetical protein